MSQQYHHITIVEFLNILFVTYTQKATAIFASGMIAIPVWHDYLSAASPEAALLAPILGCVWFIVQIVVRIFEYIKNKDRD